MPLKDRLIDFFARTKEEIPSKPPEGQLAWAANTFFGTSQGKFEKFNPDVLIGRKGFKIYYEMLRDDQIRASIHLRRNTIVSRPFRFEITEDSPKQREMEEFFKFNINRFLRGDWLQAMSGILLSEATGFSVSEMIFATGEWKGRPSWFLKAIKPKPFETFTFKVNAFGDVSEIIQQQSGGRISLDPRKFIINISNPEIDPVYGESNLRAAYRAYWEKDNILKFWNIYLERLAGGIVVATTKRALQPKEKDDLDNTLSRLSTGSYIRVPDGVDIDIKVIDDVRAFEWAIDNRNLGISRALLMPNLLGLSPQIRIGSLAQSKSHLQVFFHLISLPGNALADRLNEKVFKPLAWWNFGEEVHPLFKFDPYTEDQKKEIVKSWNKAVEIGSVTNTEKDEARTRSLIGYDEKRTGEELIPERIRNEPSNPFEKGTNGSGKIDSDTADKLNSFSESLEVIDELIDSLGEER